MEIINTSNKRGAVRIDPMNIKALISLYYKRFYGNKFYTLDTMNKLITHY